MPRSDDTLANRVKNRRKAVGMTQAALATASGLKQPDISKIELGLIEKTTGIARLADALGVSPMWLETGDGQPDAASPPPPPSGFADRREVSDSDWGLLMDVKIATTEKEKQEIRERAAELRAQVTQQLAQVSRAAAPQPIRRESLLNPDVTAPKRSVK